MRRRSRERMLLFVCVVVAASKRRYIYFVHVVLYLLFHADVSMPDGFSGYSPVGVFHDVVAAAGSLDSPPARATALDGARARGENPGGGVDNVHFNG